MNNKFKQYALGSLLAASSTVVHATLSGGEILDFTDGVTTCAIGGTPPDSCTHGITAVNTGSYFAMDTNGSGTFDNPERVAITNTGTGVTLGVAQVIGAIDTPWSFGNNFGRHHTSNGLIPTVNPDGSVNMNGWNVFWGAAGAEVNIDMGTGASATITCTSDTMTCLDGEAFTLSYETVVPGGQPFEGVAYALYLEGTVVVTSGNTAPTAVADAVTVNRSSTGNSFNILLNDTDPEANIDISTIVIQTQPTDGTATVNANGTVSYDNNGTSLDPDSFTYTVKDTGGLESNVVTVSITIKNVAVFAVDDAASMDTSAVSFIDIAVTVNDQDGNGFGIDASSVLITQQPTNGSATHLTADGIIKYTPVAGFIGTDPFEYTVRNLDGTLSDNAATVVIGVSNSEVAVLDPNAYLVFDTGNVSNPQVEPVLGEGSWFSMGVLASGPTYTPLVGFNHLHLGEAQLASSPDDNPFIPLVQNIDQAWTFFGQLGVSQTVAPPTILTDDGSGNVTLDFSPWSVSWNGIPRIALDRGLDNGVATLTCYTDFSTTTLGDCTPGDEFLLVYHATVPEGDPSNFGDVKYVLHLEGVITLTYPYSDIDGDNVADGSDNCPLIANADQADFDFDGEGDACDADADSDNIVDAGDQCLGTTLGVVVDANGCSISQYCPADNNWKNHGAYVRCVVHAAERFVADSLISEAEKDLEVSAAGGSDVAKK